MINVNTEMNEDQNAGISRSGSHSNRTEVKSLELCRWSLLPPLMLSNSFKRVLTQLRGRTTQPQQVRN